MFTLVSYFFFQNYLRLKYSRASEDDFKVRYGWRSLYWPYYFGKAEVEYHLSGGGSHRSSYPLVRSIFWPPGTHTCWLHLLTWIPIVWSSPLFKLESPAYPLVFCLYALSWFSCIPRPSGWSYPLFRDLSTHIGAVQMWRAYTTHWASMQWTISQPDLGQLVFESCPSCQYHSGRSWKLLVLDHLL